MPGIPEKTTTAVSRHNPPPFDSDSFYTNQKGQRQGKTQTPGYMGVLGIKSQMPQGQAPLQNPHPMHLSGSTRYSNPAFPRSLRKMADSGQTATQIPQSRHLPQDAQTSPQDDKSSGRVLGS
jgi:hypothetical protein